MRKIQVGLCVLVSLYAFGEKGWKDVPAAPLPAVVATATKVFLTNGGGSNLAYDAFYSAMKQWGKYEIVGSPSDADIIMELAYRVEREGTRVWSSTNTNDGTTHVRSTQIVDPQLMLTIYDGKTKNSLWSEVDHRILARREKNREKQTVISAGRLVDDLRTRMPTQALITPSSPVTKTENTVPTQMPPSVAPAARIVPITPAPVAASDSIRVSPDPTGAVTVAVVSDPPGAELFVDSKGVGSTPKQFQLKPGSHSIQVVKAGYKDWLTKLVVEEGAPTTVKAKLEK
jgi:PEGA domain